MSGPLTFICGGSCSVGVLYDRWFGWSSVSFPSLVTDSVAGRAGWVADWLVLHDWCVCVFAVYCSHYQWIDDRGKKCKCTAPQYVDYVMSYSQKCISDESIFPTKYGEFLHSHLTYWYTTW